MVMHSNLRPPVRSVLFLASLGVLASLCGAGSAAQATARSEPAPAVLAQGAGPALADAPLSAPRRRLLELAFESASAMPLDPHVKNRSRAQDAVVAACLALDQPLLALRCAERIENWRRGAGYADVAFYCAQNGAASEAERCLELARRVVAELEHESGREFQDGEGSSQPWRRDRVRAKIARTHLLLGQDGEAGRFAEGLESSEAGAVELAAAMRLQADGFDGQVRALEAAVATGEFERLRSALSVYARLFERFYADGERRALLEQRIETASRNVPTTLRIETQLELAGSALQHADPAKALAIVAQARALLAGSRWTTASHVPLVARLAALRYRAGEEVEGRKELEGARARFAAEREAMVDIYRASVLRPLAEATLAQGDRAGARELYAQAVEAGVANPNSRPRSEDLCATCCSMAVNGFEPDEALWARLGAVRAGLGEPW